MPQPIDLQTELGRLSMTEKVQQVADRASLAAQQRSAMEAEADRQAAETEVNQTDSVEQEAVESDGRRKAKEERKKRKETGESRQDAPEKRPPNDTDEHRLDVTI